MANTQIPIGSLVLAAWDANRFIDLSGGLADTGRPYVSDRLRPWLVMDFTEPTGSYALVAEGTTGPRFLASRNHLILVISAAMSIERARELARATDDPGQPATRDHAASGSFVSQDLPADQVWRDLAPFLTMPAACRVSFYCETPDVPDRVHEVFADLDPATNRGYVRCQLSLYGRVSLTDSQGIVITLQPCRICGSPWCVEGDTGYGTTTSCPDCGNSSYSDRGD